MEDIVIVAAKRTPMGRFNGYFVNTPAPELASAAIVSALKTSSLSATHIDAAFLGCVLPAGIGQAPARQAALLAGLPQSTACTTINKMCGSGMQTVIMAHDTLRAGTHSVILAGGMENMSRTPYLLPGARQGYRMGHQKMFDHMLLDGLEDAYEKGCHMGVFAEKCAKEYHITREAQDAFATTSIQRAREAIEKGYFTDEIAPVQNIDADESPLKVDLQKIPHLSPVFQKNGTITAANASSISDGAAVLLLTTATRAKEEGLTILARITGHYTHAQDPAWFTTAPIAAIRGLLTKIDWTIDQVDLFEINEAFAVVTLVAMNTLQLNPNQVNVHGGACILGHPIGASGARILVTLIHALRQRQLKRGIASLCIGGGEATAIGIEV